MSATTPLDDGEIHDLVLLFANSKIPRGSDAFQSLVDDFVKHDQPDSADEAGASDSSDSTAKDATLLGLDEVDGGKVSPLPKSALKHTKQVRIESPKTLSHVHWPDDMNSQKASSPQATHHARLYMKTTPKPILKHEDPVLPHSTDLTNNDNSRRFSSPHHI